MRDVLVEYSIALQLPMAMDYALLSVHVLEDILDVTADSNARIIAAEVLIRLSADYDLREAGYSVARVLANEDDPATLVAIRDFLQRYSACTEWCGAYVRSVDLPPILRDLF